MNRPEQWWLLRDALRWLVLGCLVAVLAGGAAAAFLLALDWATATRETHRWLVWGLPVAGFVIGWLYLRFGAAVEAGNNLLIDQVHDPRQVVPLRMAPLVLVGTVVSHLFGASVGREGTAVQMGGALADQLTHVFRLKADDRRRLLMAGISGGFAAVFGTPLAGAVFGLEVLALGRLRYDALWPCMVSAIVADQVTTGLLALAGAHHTVYAVAVMPAVGWGSITSAVLAGGLFGLMGMLFANATHAGASFMKRQVPYAPLRPLLGGIGIAAVIWFADAWRYAGLGIPVIVEAFAQPVLPWDFAAKAAMTVVSLASGFKGGEVTPLFYIGATLGNALAPLLHQPTAWLAALGFVGVFAGAANTPLACTLMAMELFGAPIGVFAALTCVASYLCSGHTGIYAAQRVGHAKHPYQPEGMPLREAAQARQQRRG